MIKPLLVSILSEEINMLLVGTRPVSVWHLRIKVSCHLCRVATTTMVIQRLDTKALRFHFCGFIRNYPGFILTSRVGSKKNDACTEYCHLKSKNRLSFRFGLSPLIDHFHLNNWLEMR